MGKYIIENNLIVFQDGETKVQFSTHADVEVNNGAYLCGGISTAGIRFSYDGNLRDKHVSLEEIAYNDKLAVWYTQEQTPAPDDGKLAKHYILGKAHIYLGNLNSGESRCIYNGDCMGDLVIQGNELLFNMGTRIAMLDLVSGKLEVLFKHGGVRNNFVSLKVNGSNIAYRHKKGDSMMLMVYNRETKKITNLKCDVINYDWLSPEELIYCTFDRTVRVDRITGKKKWFLTTKESIQVIKQVTDYFQFPVAYYTRKSSSISSNQIVFCKLYGGRIYFSVAAYWESGIEDISYDKERQLLVESGMPLSIEAIVSCPMDEKVFTVEHNNEGWTRSDRMINQYPVYDLKTKYNPFI